MALKRRSFIKTAIAVSSMTMLSKIALGAKKSSSSRRVVVIGGGFAVLQQRNISRCGLPILRLL